MNDHEALERELAALRPVEPSPQLKARIARELDAAPAKAGRGVWLAVAGGALAASLAIYALWRSEPPAPAVEPIRFRTESTTAAAFDAALPSLWSYRQALGRSYGDVDQLLDLHGRKPNEQPPSSQRAGVAAASVFARSDSQLETLLGEL
jgi:hypothetical protein